MQKFLVSNMINNIIMSVKLLYLKYTLIKYQRKEIEYVNMLIFPNWYTLEGIPNIKKRILKVEGGVME